MRKLVILTTVLSAASVACGQGWEGDLLDFQAEFHGTVGVTYESMYIWRGFRVFGNKSAVSLLADVTLSDTGFGVSAVGHRANSSGYEKNERWDYTLYYQNGLFPEERYATNYRFGWVYYNYPQRNQDESIDLQELQAVLQWPKILGIEGLCPSYVAVKLWPSKHGSLLPEASSGWAHILMLDYGFTVPGIIPEIPEHVIKLHSELVYNDGVTPNPEQRNPDHRFSNAVFGVSTDINIGSPNLVFTPGIFYQITMDKSHYAETIGGTPVYDGGVDQHDDELWGSFGLKYTF